MTTNYYNENKDKWKDYNSGEYYRRYHRNYYNDNKEELSKRNKEYYKKFSGKYEGKFIYFILNKNNDIKYIGKTSNIYSRVAVHKYDGTKYDPETDRIIWLRFKY